MTRRKLTNEFDNKAGSAVIIPQNNGLVPTVVESDGRGERAYDLFSRLMKDRIILLTGEVNDQSASIIKAQILFLENEDPNKKITLYIDSPGGSITAGLAIYDTMRNVKCVVETIGSGMCASMGSFLLSAGTPGHRIALPNTTVMVHQPLVGGGQRTKETELGQNAAHLERTRRRMEMLYAQFMGFDVKNKNDVHLVHKLCEQDTYLNAEMAKQLGLVDSVAPPKELRPQYWIDRGQIDDFDVISMINQMEIDEIDENDDDPKKMGIVKKVILRHAEATQKTAAISNDNQPAPPLPARKRDTGPSMK